MKFLLFIRDNCKTSQTAIENVTSGLQHFINQLSVILLVSFMLILLFIFKKIFYKLSIIIYLFLFRINFVRIPILNWDLLQLKNVSKLLSKLFSITQIRGQVIITTI